MFSLSLNSLNPVYICHLSHLVRGVDLYCSLSPVPSLTFVSVDKWVSTCHSESVFKYFLESLLYYSGQRTSKLIIVYIVIYFTTQDQGLFCLLAWPYWLNTIMKTLYFLLCSISWAGILFNVYNNIYTKFIALPNYGILISWPHVCI